MSALHDAWTSLRHGGNLLSPEALDALPQPGRAPPGLADQLRAARTALPPDRPATGEALSALLDVVLEETTGLHAGWRKGTAVGASDAAQLLDGTVLKPRRLWSGPDGEALAVFTTPETRIGVGRGRRPVAQVTEYLRRRNVPLGLLTNGREWRLIWADTDGLAWVEWDADRWLEADQLSPSLHLLRLLLSWAALTRGKAEHPPLLVAIRDTRRGQGKLSKELGERVRRAVETLLRARRATVAPAWEAHAAADLYVAACHIVMRLVVVLFAEARELLPCDNPVYHQAYGLRGMLDQLDRLSPERRRSRHSAWPRLLALFRLLHGGSPHPSINVLAYGGDLFKAGDPRGDGVQRALALLENLADPPDDDVLHRVLVLLTRTTQRVREGAVWRTVAAPVDFTELTSEYIGILYEGLLDYELHKAGDQPVVFLALGDQPALPLDRLEAMDDKALFALVEKAKVKRASGAGEDEEGEEEAEEADEEAGDQPDEPVAAIEEETPDDTRAAARARAIAWAERAAVVGKLVKAPRGKKSADDPAFREQLRAAASQLIADLELPGELYLVRWGGTRKGAGTFYTRPQLTLPTVRRTLEPLLRDPAGQIRTPEVLLALKVCDPAMGSGSFLVAALRVLTAAVIESLHVHGRVVRDGDRLTVDCAVLPEGDGALSGGNTEDLLDAIVRRAVVEHCLYGVDIDPLAVELARVSLWVETLDRRLPFTFLDHKLRCGDALVGTWLDRFRDYPLLAFSRQSPDLKWKGVHHAADIWHKALQKRREEVIEEQAELLAGKQHLPFVATSDDELKAAIERMRRLYRELRRVPAGRPDERARIWRERIQADPALKRVREAFDTWCALWFWPLDRIAEAPGPRTLAQPVEAAREVVKDVAERVRFFHWELEFPDLFTEEGAGFDAVVGNPPWETQKPLSLEFFSNYDPMYRTYGKQDGLAVQVALFDKEREIEDAWLSYVGIFKDKGNFVRFAAEPYGDGKIAGHDGGNVSLGRGREGEALHRRWRGQRARFSGTSDPAHPFRHQGSADLNTYKMFVELGHAVLRADGQLGVVVPSGLYSDKGSEGLRRVLFEQCRWRALYVFQNERKFFRDVHHSQKQCVVLAAKGGSTTALPTMFMLGPSDSPEAEDIQHHLESGWSPLTMDVGLIDLFSPDSRSILELTRDEDLRILKKMYLDAVLLGSEAEDSWGVEYAREFDMTNDSRFFIARDRAEAQGYRADVYGRWVNDQGEMLLPLYEGRMIGQFDFSEKGWVNGKGRTAVWEGIGWERKLSKPQYLMDRLNVAVSPGQAKVVFMDVSAAINTRTTIACVGDEAPCGHSAPTLRLAGDVGQTLSLCAILNSFVFDCIVRQRVVGLHLTLHYLQPCPLPPPANVPDAVAQISLRLAAPAPRFAPWWITVGQMLRDRVTPWRRLWAITPHERLRLRAMLDAIVAALYGLDRADFAWILRDCDHPTAQLRDRAFCRTLDPKGFWRVDKDQDPELRHTVLSLVAFDALQTSIGAHNGDRDAGIRAFCDQNDGDGWMLPDTLRLADHGLGHDDRALAPQPVASRLGPRFLDWQLAQTPEESWAECERHAKAILEGAPAPLATPAPQPPAPPPERDLGPLFRKRS